MLIRSGHLLTETDDDIGDALTGYFRDEGIDVRAQTTLLGAQRRGNEKVVRYVARRRESRRSPPSEIFYALGREPERCRRSTSSSAGVVCAPGGGIVVDETMRTSNPDIYAVGDVTGEYMLVHVAIYQGEVAARNACLNLDERADYRLTAAHTVFSDPQVAAVGMSEKELQRRSLPYVSGRYEFAEHGKAQCLAKTKGFVKMMADPRQR